MSSVLTGITGISSPKTQRIQSFAERILFGDSLVDKLIDADSFVDDAPGVAFAAPALPGRPRELALIHTRAGKKTQFPGVGELDQPGRRGQVLHFFANHELLALELMALALLRFPDAPAEWRMGIAHTMREEQSHLRLYLERMAGCGVELGQIPVNAFFWDALRDMRSPLDFITHMSLTFEQANLDFSADHAHAFRAAGDEDTASVLERVYQEEIGHVRHGVTWFNRLRGPGGSDWDAFRAQLRIPFNPGRARGTGFDRAGRLAAGLSEQFVDELEVFPTSRGRPPSVWLFNPACEDEVAHGGPGYRPPGKVATLQRDLECLPMFLATTEDAVLVTRRPTTAFLRTIQQAGFTLPRIIECEMTRGGVAACELAGEPLTALRPWGASPESSHLLDPLGAVPVPDRSIYSKATSAQLLAAVVDEIGGAASGISPPETVGVVCTSSSEVSARTAELRDLGYLRVLCKAELSCSGQHRTVLEGAVSPSQRGWIERTLGRGQLVVEPLLDRRVDLSAQLTISRDGVARLDGLTRFFTDARGQFRSAIVGNPLGELSPELWRFLSDGKSRPVRLDRALDVVMRHVGRACRDAGYEGWVGVDMFIHADLATGAPVLRPLVEVNPRCTMGRIALALGRRVPSGRVGLFEIVPRDCVLPLQRCRLRDETLIDSCDLSLSDPSLAEASLATLRVAPTLAECARGTPTP